MRLLFCVLFLLTCTACASSGASVELSGKKFSVDIADSSEEQALGLMFRNNMPADHGMLFIFPSVAVRSFLMINSRF
jgi:uncharacterized membrane protein (UPF0127 family)